ncbi:tRNA (adenosine(37)-N6)-threonylcarbamoyltransferase complex ATPase subunit type 1 TsaE [Thalassobacillus sp. CUG 92003]|uniref:tRNA (adenosine(37)-N6)-threonylcarbamoyltransferase complex ATPase subunit type 1 TsaE n=1 Tax=Thalassobacillus sp. CUG 92003 TaxID=2736641 RepID=UPI0015E66248|nr:tRNA (adenosine(37)-N6)-threonylcarbamoyltransferase complex ATPase subunit type 1 TsaE [Thalassobacillus sp. CUG 92003]
MEAYEIKTDSPEATMALAEKLGTKLMAGDVLTMEGDLGAGKTTFTKGLGKGLGVSRTINSPTFTIVKEYMGRLPLFHIDAYRLEDSEEDIGFDDYFEGGGVTVVEWAQYITAFLPAARLDIHLRIVDNQVRSIELRPGTPHFEKICKEIVA